MLNKKGHLATALMVFAALFLAVFALFVMITFEDKTEGLEKEMVTLQGGFIFNEKIVLSSFEKILSDSIFKAGEKKGELPFLLVFEAELKRKNELRRKSEIVDITNLFGKIANEDYVLTGDEEYVLEVGEVFVVNTEGNNEVKKKFELTARFNDKEILEIRRD